MLSQKKRDRYNIRIITHTLWILIIIIFLFMLACSKKKGNGLTEAELAKMEVIAKEMSIKGEVLISSGKQIEAYLLYQQLALKYPETETKKKIEAELLKKGISIGAPLSSLSSKKMIEFENKILRYKEKNGVYPKGTEVVMPLDAWGNLIYYKIFTDKEAYDFIVYSRGPDKKKDTGDELLIVHQIGEDEGKVAEVDEEQFISKDKMKSLLPNEGEDEMSTDASELTISLDNLEDSFGQPGDSNSNEVEMSLEKLLKENRDERTEKSSQELNLSLEELIKEEGGEK